MTRKAAENAQRRDWGCRMVIEAYGVDEDGYTDLITDLLLLAHAQGLDVARIQRAAEMHYEHELQEASTT